MKLYFISLDHPIGPLYAQDQGANMKLFEALRNGASNRIRLPIQIDEDCNYVYSPSTGSICAMEELPDPVFSGGMLGEAVGVWPDKGIAYAPISGLVTAAMPHAFGITADNGPEVLIHIGVDTVEMRGDGFDVFVRQGTRVTAGEPLLTFDKKKIERAGYKDIVITAVVNSSDFSGIHLVSLENAVAGKPLFHIER